LPQAGTFRFVAVGEEGSDPKDFEGTHVGQVEYEDAGEAAACVEAVTPVRDDPLEVPHRAAFGWSELVWPAVPC
jgi:hypothetical protein